MGYLYPFGIIKSRRCSYCFSCIFFINYYFIVYLHLLPAAPHLSAVPVDLLKAAPPAGLPRATAQLPAAPAPVTVHNKFPHRQVPDN